ncbi:MAG TPA: hypothetical protein VN976_07215 [Verrucomicrobiae bacterium]|nr:hypothetical protein [Verrucomicrobiae bacterium]
MRIRKLRTIVGTLSWIMALSLAGCRSAKQPAPADVKEAAERADITEEARGVAEAALGKQAEILARGDLALNGNEQLLVVNRVSKQAASGVGGENPPIFVTRAAVLEQMGGKWSEVLLCDEHLKNPNGYLGGSPVGRINDWKLEFSQDAKVGLEMKFSPADIFDAINVHTGERIGLKNATFDVRWNKNAKRYQSFDQSHERYLSEVPSLETPQSILK